MKSLLLLATGLAAPLLPAVDEESGPPIAGEVAPPHAIERWGDVDPGANVRPSRSDPLSPEDKTLAERHGEIVLLYAKGGEREQEATELVVDLLLANADRGITAFALVASGDPRPIEDLRSDRFELPIGVVEAGGSPYLPGAGEAAPLLTVVGRSGQIVWRGNPREDEKELLAALHPALLAWPGLALEGGLDPALAKAVEAYFAGEWAKARKLAEKVEKGAKTEAVAQSAAAFRRRIDELESALLEEVRGTRGMFEDLKLLRLHRGLARGFPKSRACEEIETIIEGRSRTLLGGSAFFDAQKWIEMEEKRPVLFPRRKDAAGKKFAGKLGRLVKNTNDTTLTRTIKGMLTEFEGH